MSKAERDAALTKITQLFRILKHLKCEPAYNVFVKQLLYHNLAFRLFNEQTDEPNKNIDDTLSDLIKSTLITLQSQIVNH